MSRFRQMSNYAFKPIFWLFPVVLLTAAGCLGPIQGTIALRDAQDLFNEASIETIEQYQRAVRDQPLEALPPESPNEKYQKVVEIIEERVLNSVTRDDLKVNAYAIAAFAHWRLRNYKKAKSTAEVGLDFYKRSGLMTNRRDYGMLLILGGLVDYSEAYWEYQNQLEKEPETFFTPAYAENITQLMAKAIDKIDKINHKDPTILKMDTNEPIVVYANQQQLRIVDSILEVWGNVKQKEDQREPICNWSSRAQTIWKTKFPKDKYPAKPHVDELYKKIHKVRTGYECADSQ